MNHVLNDLFSAPPEAWVHASWGERLFPSHPPDSATLSEMIDDPELRRHLMVLGEKGDLRVPALHHARSSITEGAAVAVRLLNNDPRRFFSLVGHCASIPEIRACVMGKATVCGFDPAESLLALDLMADDLLTCPDGVSGSPPERGRSLFGAWLSTREEPDLCFLLLVMDADAPVNAPEQPGEALHAQAAFVDGLLIALSRAWEAEDE